MARSHLCRADRVVKKFRAKFVCNSSPPRPLLKGGCAPFLLLSRPPLLEEEGKVRTIPLGNSPFPKAGNGYLVVPFSMAQRIHDVVDAHSDRPRAFGERLLPVVEVFPEVADVVVVVCDDLKLAVRVRHTPELRRKVSVRRFHVEVIDIVEAVKYRMPAAD